MDRRFSGFVMGIFAVFLIIAIAALFLGPNVAVHSNNWIYKSSDDGRYMLNVFATDAATTYGVVDTETGITYTFRQSDAHRVIPPLPSEEATAE
jgi:uncharacterized membrane protein required for colicin V production